MLDERLGPIVAATVSEAFGGPSRELYFSSTGFCPHGGYLDVYSVEALVYDFHGLMEDGRYYVNFCYPVSAPMLLDGPDLALLDALVNSLRIEPEG